MLRISRGPAQLEGEHDAALVVGVQRLQQRLPRRRRPDRLGRRLGLDPSAAQGLLEGAAVLPIQDEEHDEPRHREDERDDGHHRGPNADRMQHDDQQHADRGVRPPLDERVDGGLDAAPLARMNRGVVDLGRRLAERLEDDALEPSHRDDRPPQGADDDPRGEQHRRDRLQGGGRPEAESFQQPPRHAELEQQRERVQADVELAEELRERVRVRVEMLDEELELEVDERRTRSPTARARRRAP